MSALVERLLKSRAVAVVGASERNFYARNVIENLQRRGFTGSLYGINPRGEDVLGVRCFPTLAAADAVDVAVIAVGRDSYLDTVRQAADAGVQTVVALTSGLSETGEPAWVDVDAQAQEIADRAGMALLGPNGLGFIDNTNGLFAWGAPVPWPLRQGSTALVMESGGLLCTSLGTASALGLGLGVAATIGNGRQTRLVDWVTGLCGDPRSRQVGLMLESMPPWEPFSAGVRAGRAAGQRYYAVKVGKTAAGAKAAATHTGALAGSYPVAAGLLRQLGIAECRSIPGLLVGLALQERFGDAGTGGLAVLTASGGAASIIADACSERGVRLAELSDETVTRLDGRVGITSVDNPIDVGGQALAKPGEFAEAAAVLLADPAVAALLYVPTLGFPLPEMGAHQTLLDHVTDLAATSAKPVVVTQLGFGSNTSDALGEAPEPGPMLLPTLEFALDGLGPWMDQPGHRVAPGPAVDSPPAAPRTDLPSEAVLKGLLAERGLTVPASVEYQPGSGPEGLPFAPAVLKGMSPGVLHKNHYGLVELPLVTADQLRAAEVRMLAAAEAAGLTIDTFLLEEMADAGADMFLSISEQPSGTVVTLGAGGTDVEERGEVGFLGWPASRSELDAFADHALPTARPGDRSRVLELITRLTEVMDEQGLAVLECNPIRFAGERLLVLDAVGVPTEEAR